MVWKIGDQFLTESASLFETTVSDRVFSNAALILFRNKTDLLEEKVQMGELSNYRENGEKYVMQAAFTPSKVTVEMVSTEITFLLLRYAYGVESKKGPISSLHPMTNPPSWCHHEIALALLYVPTKSLKPSPAASLNCPKLLTSKASGPCLNLLGQRRTLSWRPIYKPVELPSNIRNLPT
ncbi:hypothetical protein CB1_000877002 [Camelus ferus]|nr:hypothetical protein CB1_000877002 [Camelus ferus]